ncbi:uncharacterized protein LOC123439136 [Hordeum vulgare subsp. vulgare]|uniref:uncharacterized protein LOC123439136 n=1 Tax=Hordeum vulgare subsp. vulgare TaxID=112509 RepID=UPI000B464D1C|nr:uncharacterized protein LOC123439136 [Hordeum vulgare subsp. vulgare]KAI5003996.1 hypothetical protein ZWY2020_031239 [Hordeum vulgare]
MKRASCSSAMTILAILFICCSLPCSVATQVHTEGTRHGVSPPSPWAPPSPDNRGRGHSETPPPLLHRKNLQLQHTVVPVPPMA